MQVADIYFDQSVFKELISKLLLKYFIYMSDTCNIVYNHFMSQIRLGFWKSRGRGQIPRLLLTYTGTKFEERMYKDRKEWFEGDRQSLNLDFPKLPYLIDGDYRLSEPRAISFYIIEKSKRGQELLGKDFRERAKIYDVVGVISKMLQLMERLVFKPQAMPSREETWKERISPKLKRLSTLLGNREWLFDRMTVADFVLAELSFFIEMVFPNEYKNLQFLSKHRQRFQSIPEIRSYYERQDAIKGLNLPESKSFKSPTMDVEKMKQSPNV